MRKRENWKVYHSVVINKDRLDSTCNWRPKRCKKEKMV